MRFSRHNVIYRLRHTSFFSNFSFLVVVVVVVVFVVFVKSNRIESEKRMNRMPYPTTPWICRVRNAPVPYKNSVPYTKNKAAPTVPYFSTWSERYPLQTNKKCFCFCWGLPVLAYFRPHGPLRKYVPCVCSARMDHYENIFDACFLPARSLRKHFWSVFSSARTITKTFLKRLFCPHGPTKNILWSVLRGISTRKHN